MQDGFLARIIQDEGATLTVGEPIAVVCEEEEELQHWSGDKGADGLAGVPDEALERRFSWQAYVKPEDAEGLGGMCSASLPNSKRPS